METLILIFILSLAWGSFLNVVIYRLPRNLSLIRPPSSCPGCGRHIPPYENIPLLSYLLLRGRCRSCGYRIPLSYLFVEMTTPLSMILLFLKFGPTAHFASAALFASGLIILGMIDLEHRILPDEITLPGILLALIYTAFRPDMTLHQSLIGALSGALFLLLVYAVYYLLRRQEGLGMGDVTFMLFIGAFLGWKLSLFTLIAASFSGALTGLILILGKKQDMQSALPFGTFLAPAAFLALMVGDSVISWYLGLFIPH